MPRVLAWGTGQRAPRSTHTFCPFSHGVSAHRGSFCVFPAGHMRRLRGRLSSGSDLPSPGSPGHSSEDLQVQGCAFLRQITRPAPLPRALGRLRRRGA